MNRSPVPAPVAVLKDRRRYSPAPEARSWYHPDATRHPSRQRRTEDGWISFARPHIVAAETVTVVKGFTGIGQAEQETLAKEMQKACGTGRHSEGGTNRNSGRPARGSRAHLDQCRVPACVCRRLTGWRLFLACRAFLASLAESRFAQLTSSPARGTGCTIIRTGRPHASSITERPPS